MEKEKPARRQRVDSKEGQVAAMIHANRRIDPPQDMIGEMNEVDIRLFNEIIDEAPNITWTGHTIRVAAILARTLHDMLEDQRELRDEGSVLMNDKGNYVMNPRRTACQGYAGQIINLRRTLALHATAGTSKRDVGKRRNYQKGAEDNAPEDEDDLIPMAPPAPLR